MSADGRASIPTSWRAAYTLPAFTTPLVGRERDCNQALGLLRSGSRLLTVSGPAGIGKTRLAVEVASRFAGDHRGAAFLNLAPLRDGAALPGLIASVCALDGWPDLPISRLPESLGTVLVLDGFDHMQDAATTLTALIDRCPGAVVIVTCLEPLQLPGESVITLGPLTSEPIAGQVSVAGALLIERAGLAADNVFAAEGLAAFTGGNPLAIEIVAAHLRAGTIRPFQQRTDGPWRLPDLIGWCIAALDPDERTLLLRLSVMAAGFDTGAVLAVFQAPSRPGGSPLELMDHLVRLGLVSRRMLPGGGPRFELPTTIREVALAQLNDSGELVASRLAFARHLLELALAMREQLFTRERDRALVWFETEQAALRLAFGTFVQLRKTYLARRLALALWPWWLLRRHFRVGRRWLKLALELYDPAEPDTLEQELLVASGLLELYGGHLKTSRSRSAEAARPGLSGGQDEWRGASLGTLGLLAALDGEYDRAIGLYRIFLESTEAHRSPGSWLPPLRTVIGVALSAALFARGEVDEAEYHATIALKSALRLGDPLLVGYARIHLAIIATAKEDLLLAVETFQDGISLLLERPHIGAVATSLLGLARLAMNVGRYATASRLVDLSKVLLEAGTPPPPLLIRIDPDELLALLQQLPRKDIPRVEPTPPPEGIAEVERIIQQAFVDLTQQIAPEAAQPKSHGCGKLTNRELEVLCLLTEDMSNREIADALFIGERTAEEHVQHILDKLDVKSRTGAVAYAMREGCCS